MTTPPAGSERRKSQAERVESSRGRLLGAAVELFAERGYDGTTAAEIGERAGYSRAMVRERYGSKEALLEHMLREEFEPKMLAASPDGVSGADEIIGRVRMTLAMVESDPQLIRAFWVLSFETVRSATVMRTWIQSWLSRYQRETEEAVRRGQADGSVSPAVEPRAFARSVVQRALGIAFQWCLDPALDLATDVDGWTSDITAALTP